MSKRTKATVAEAEAPPPAPARTEPFTVPAEPFRTQAIEHDKPTDECVCSHHRSAHSGKTERKKCTAKIWASGALGDGKCDCACFRLRVKR